MEITCRIIYGFRIKAEMAMVTISEVLALFFHLGTLFAVIQPILASGEEGCDLKTQYVLKNSTSGMFIRCQDVRPCKAGKEPEIPSGSVIDIYQTVGPCLKCKKGTYSATEDTEPCHVCRSERCFDHQVVKGTCLTNRVDTSNCTDRCQIGFAMNQNKTACQAINTTINPTQNKTDGPSPYQTDKPLSKNTDKPPPKNTDRPLPKNTNRPLPKNTNKVPPKNTDKPRPNNTGKPLSKNTDKLLVNNTDKPVLSTNSTKKAAEQSDDEPPGVIAGIVIGVMALVMFIFSPMLVLGIISERKAKANSKDNEESAGAALKKSDASRDDEPETTQVKEVADSNSGPASDNINRDTHLENPKVSTLISFDESHGCVRAATPLETSMQPPTNILMRPLLHPTGTLLQQPMMPITFHDQPASMPVFYIPNASYVNRPQSQFDGLSFQMYQKICECFDRDLPGKDWKALASWLDLNVMEFRAIENLTEGKTNKIIEIWLTKAGNDVDSFVDILNRNNMTCLANEILEALHTSRTVLSIEY